MNKGSSLLELLIAVVLTAVVAVVATSLLFTTLGASGKASGLSYVKQNGDQAIQLLEREIREAKSANCTTATELLIVDEDGDDHVVTLDAATSSIQMTNPGNQILTSTDIEASVFTCVVTPGADGQPEVIRINFTLTLAPGGRPVETVSEDFQTFVSLRTYE